MQILNYTQINDLANALKNIKPRTKLCIDTSQHFLDNHHIHGILKLTMYLALRKNLSIIFKVDLGHVSPLEERNILNRYSGQNSPIIIEMIRPKKLKCETMTTQAELDFLDRASTALRNQEGLIQLHLDHKLCLSKELRPILVEHLKNPALRGLNFNISDPKLAEQFITEMAAVDGLLDLITREQLAGDMLDVSCMQYSLPPLELQDPIYHAREALRIKINPHIKITNAQGIATLSIAKSNFDGRLVSALLQILDDLIIKHDIQHLDISDNRLSALDVLVIVDALSVSTSLKTIDCANNCPADGVNLPRQTLNFTTLVKKFKQASRLVGRLNDLITAINAHTKQTTDLSVSFTQETAAYILTTPTLLDADVYSSLLRGLDASHAEFVEFILERLSLLSKDSFTRTNIRSLKLESLPKQITTLKKLELRDLDLTDEDAPVLLEILKKGRQLKEIDLSFNYLSDNSGKILIEGLRTLPQLMRLDLSNNRLSDLDYIYTQKPGQFTAPITEDTSDDSEPPTEESTPVANASTSPPSSSSIAVSSPSTPYSNASGTEIASPDVANEAARSSQAKQQDEPAAAPSEPSQAAAKKDVELDPIQKNYYEQTIRSIGRRNIFEETCKHVGLAGTRQAIRDYFQGTLTELGKHPLPTVNAIHTQITHSRILGSQDLPLSIAHDGYFALKVEKHTSGQTSVPILQLEFAEAGKAIQRLEIHPRFGEKNITNSNQTVNTKHQPENKYTDDCVYRFKGTHIIACTLHDEIMLQLNPDLSITLDSDFNLRISSHGDMKQTSLIVTNVGDVEVIDHLYNFNVMHLSSGPSSILNLHHKMSGKSAKLDGGQVSWITNPGRMGAHPLSSIDELTIHSSDTLTLNTLLRITKSLALEAQSTLHLAQTNIIKVHQGVIHLKAGLDLRIMGQLLSRKLIAEAAHTMHFVTGCDVHTKEATLFASTVLKPKLGLTLGKLDEQAVDFKTTKGRLRVVGGALQTLGTGVGVTSFATGPLGLAAATTLKVAGTLTLAGCKLHDLSVKGRDDADFVRDGLKFGFDTATAVSSTFLNPICFPTQFLQFCSTLTEANLGQTGKLQMLTHGASLLTHGGAHISKHLLGAGPEAQQLLKFFKEAGTYTRQLNSAQVQLTLSALQFGAMTAMAGDRHFDVDSPHFERYLQSGIFALTRNHIAAFTSRPGDHHYSRKYIGAKLIEFLMDGPAAAMLLDKGLSAINAADLWKTDAAHIELLLRSALGIANNHQVRPNWLAEAHLKQAEQALQLILGLANVAQTASDGFRSYKNIQGDKDKDHRQILAPLAGTAMGLLELMSSEVQKLPPALQEALRVATQTYKTANESDSIKLYAHHATLNGSLQSRHTNINTGFAYGSAESFDSSSSSYGLTASQGLFHRGNIRNPVNAWVPSVALVSFAHLSWDGAMCNRGASLISAQTAKIGGRFQGQKVDIKIKGQGGGAYDIDPTAFYGVKLLNVHVDAIDPKVNLNYLEQTNFHVHGTNHKPLVYQHSVEVGQVNLYHNGGGIVFQKGGTAHGVFNIHNAQYVDFVAGQFRLRQGGRFKTKLGVGIGIPMSRDTSNKDALRIFDIEASNASLISDSTFNIQGGHILNRGVLAAETLIAPNVELTNYNRVQLDKASELRAINNLVGSTQVLDGHIIGEKISPAIFICKETLTVKGLIKNESILAAQHLNNPGGYNGIKYQQIANEGPSIQTESANIQTSYINDGRAHLGISTLENLCEFRNQAPPSYMGSANDASSSTAVTQGSSMTIRTQDGVDLINTGALVAEGKMLVRAHNIHNENLNGLGGVLQAGVFDIAAHDYNGVGDRVLQTSIDTQLEDFMANVRLTGKSNFKVAQITQADGSVLNVYPSIQSEGNMTWQTAEVSETVPAFLGNNKFAFILSQTGTGRMVFGMAHQVLAGLQINANKRTVVINHPDKSSYIGGRLEVLDARKFDIKHGLLELAQGAYIESAEPIDIGRLQTEMRSLPDDRTYEYAKASMVDGILSAGLVEFNAPRVNEYALLFAQMLKMPKGSVLSIYGTSHLELPSDIGDVRIERDHTSFRDLVRVVKGHDAQGHARYFEFAENEYSRVASDGGKFVINGLDCQNVLNKGTLAGQGLHYTGSFDAPSLSDHHVHNYLSKHYETKRTYKAVLITDHSTSKEYLPSNYVDIIGQGDYRNQGRSIGEHLQISEFNKVVIGKLAGNAPVNDLSHFKLENVLLHQMIDPLFIDSTDGQSMFKLRPVLGVLDTSDVKPRVLISDSPVEGPELVPLYDARAEAYLTQQELIKAADYGYSGPTNVWAALREAAYTYALTLPQNSELIDAEGQLKPGACLTITSSQLNNAPYALLASKASRSQPTHSESVVVTPDSTFSPYAKVGVPVALARHVNIQSDRENARVDNTAAIRAETSGFIKAKYVNNVQLSYGYFVTASANKQIKAHKVKVSDVCIGGIISFHEGQVVAGDYYQRGGWLAKTGTSSSDAELRPFLFANNAFFEATQTHSLVQSQLTQKGSNYAIVPVFHAPGISSASPLLMVTQNDFISYSLKLQVEGAAHLQAGHNVRLLGSQASFLLPTFGKQSLLSGSHFIGGSATASLASILEVIGKLTIVAGNEMTLEHVHTYATEAHLQALKVYLTNAYGHQNQWEHKSGLQGLNRVKTDSRTSDTYCLPTTFNIEHNLTVVADFLYKQGLVYNIGGHLIELAKLIEEYSAIESRSSSRRSESIGITHPLAGAINTALRGGSVNQLMSEFVNLIPGVQPGRQVFKPGQYTAERAIHGINAGVAAYQGLEQYYVQGKAPADILGLNATPGFSHHVSHDHQQTTTHVPNQYTIGGSHFSESDTLNIKANLLVDVGSIHWEARQGMVIKPPSDVSSSISSYVGQYLTLDSSEIKASCSKGTSKAQQFTPGFAQFIVRNAFSLKVKGKQASIDLENVQVKAKHVAITAPKLILSTTQGESKSSQSHVSIGFKANAANGGQVMPDIAISLIKSNSKMATQVSSIQASEGFELNCNDIELVGANLQAPIADVQTFDQHNTLIAQGANGALIYFEAIDLQVSPFTASLTSGSLQLKDLPRLAARYNQNYQLWQKDEDGHLSLVNQHVANSSNDMLNLYQDDATSFIQLAVTDGPQHTTVQVTGSSVHNHAQSHKINLNAMMPADTDSAIQSFGSAMAGKGTESANLQPGFIMGQVNGDINIAANIKRTVAELITDKKSSQTSFGFVALAIDRERVTQDVSTIWNGIQESLGNEAPKVILPASQQQVAAELEPLATVPKAVIRAKQQKPSTLETVPEDELRPMTIDEILAGERANEAFTPHDAPLQGDVQADMTETNRILNMGAAAEARYLPQNDGQPSNFSPTIDTSVPNFSLTSSAPTATPVPESSAATPSTAAELARDCLRTTARSRVSITEAALKKLQAHYPNIARKYLKTKVQLVVKQILGGASPEQRLLVDLYQNHHKVSAGTKPMVEASSAAIMNVVPFIAYLVAQIATQNMLKRPQQHYQDEIKQDVRPQKVKPRQALPRAQIEAATDEAYRDYCRARNRMFDNSDLNALFTNPKTHTGLFNEAPALSSSSTPPTAALIARLAAINHAAEGTRFVTPATEPSKPTVFGTPIHQEKKPSVLITPSHDSLKGATRCDKYTTPAIEPQRPRAFIYPEADPIDANYYKKKNEAPKSANPRDRDHKCVQKPKPSHVETLFPGAGEIKGKNPIQGGGGKRPRYRLKNGDVIEWEGKKGCWELWDRNMNNHKGELSNEHGQLISPGVRSRKMPKDLKP